MIKAIIRFFGPDVDNYGMPVPYFAYWVVASPWQSHDSGIATIMPLSTGPVVVSTSGTPVSPHHPVLKGGEEAAFQAAIEALKNAAAHIGLQFREDRE